MKNIDDPMGLLESILESIDQHAAGPELKDAKELENEATEENKVEVSAEEVDNKDVYPADEHKQEEDVVVYKEEFKEKIYPLFINTYNLNPNGTLMVKRSCFKIKDVESYYKLRFAEDLKLSLELFDNALSVTIISDVLYNYFTNYSSATKSNNIDKILYNMGNFITVYSLMYKYLEKWKIDTEENLKKLNLKVLREIATFYTKIKLSDDVEFIENNKEKIKNMIYSDIVLNAIDSVNEEDLDKNDKYYNSLIAIYKKSI